MRRWPNGGHDPVVEIRPRRDEDVPALVGALDAVCTVDRYPPHVPGDLEALIATPYELSAFVAEMDGRPVGHVALHPYTARAVMAAASEATATPVASLAAVARLFVDLGARGAGVGSRLLETVTVEATRLGRTPILDVWSELDAAIAMYESAGWRRIGQVSFEFKSGCTSRCAHTGPLRSFVYAGPSEEAHQSDGTTA